MFKKFSLWFLRIGAWILLKLRVYYRLSYIYQRLQLTWASKGPELPTLESLEDLEVLLHRMKWRKDTLLEWFDTFEHPRAIWAKYVAHPDRGVEDCDGFAIFAADRITDMIQRGVETRHGVLLEARILTVAYVGGGHNVCAVRYKNDAGELRWAHIGNWYAGRFQADYASIQAIARHVAGVADIIYWAVATPELRLVEHGWNTESES